MQDSQWQVRLRRSNIYSKVCYMVFLHQKQVKSLFWANLMIFKNSWLFSESFGYFMHHSYQIWLIWLKIQILWLILDWIDVSNQSLGPLGIKGAVLVLEPTTVHGWVTSVSSLYTWTVDCVLSLYCICSRQALAVMRQWQRTALAARLTIWQYVY